jgi:hypothetical protein
MQKVTVKEQKVRKAIFVNAAVFEKFKEAAQNDGRKYSEFLEHLLENK